MFEKLITEVLNKVLGQFIENIDPAQLNISITSGKVRLENMKIKSTVFDALPVPFALVYGQIGLIDLTIPVWNMFNSPLIIEIKDVFAFVKPKYIKEWSEEVETSSYKRSTQSILEQFELFNSNVETLKKKDPSSVDKLLNKIIDNLQVTIKNLYVRYEDTESAKNQGDGRFIVGILLKEISATTTGSDWKSVGLQIGKDITYKLAKVKQFTMFMDYKNGDQKNSSEGKYKPYMNEDLYDVSKLFSDKTNQLFKKILEMEFKTCESDKSGETIEALESQQHAEYHHYYMIDKFSLEARIEINKDPQTNLQPQVTLNLLLGGQYKHLQEYMADLDQESKAVPILQKVQINFAVKQPQIIRVLKLIEYIGYYNEFREGALANFFTKKVTKEIADDYIHKYVVWKQLTAKSQKQADQKQKELKEIEDQFALEKVMTLRKYGLKLIEQQEERAKDKEEYDKKLKEIKSAKASGWFTSKEKKAQNEKEIEELSQKLQAELQLKEQIVDTVWEKEMEELQKEMSKESKGLEMVDFNKMPDTYARFKFLIEVPSLRLAFMNEFSQGLFVAQIEEQISYLEIGKCFFKSQFSLRSLMLEDNWSGAEAFPNIIETKDIISEQGQHHQHNMFHKLEARQALLVQVESGKDVSIAPFKISIQTQKTLFVVANLFFVQELQRSLLASLNGETLDFSFYVDAVSQQALTYMQMGKDMIETLKTGDFQHKAIDAWMELRAPVIVIPENVFIPHKSCLVVDVGVIKIKSNLRRFESFVDYKMITTADAVFDKYEVKLQELQINILENGLPKGTSHYDKNEQSISLIKNFTVATTIFNCLDPFHPVYPTVEVMIQLKNIDINIDLQMANAILQIQNHLLDIWENKDMKQIIMTANLNNPNHEVKIDQSIHQKQIEESKESAKVAKAEIAEKHEAVQQFREKVKEEKKGLDKDGDSFLMTLEEDMKARGLDLDDVLKKKKEEEDRQRALQKNQITNFKLYFSVQKLAVHLQDEMEIEAKNFTKFANFLQANTHVNVDIHKFIIEDVSGDARLALPFRMLLSSPQVEYQRYTNAIMESNEDFEEFVPAGSQSAHLGTLYRKSVQYKVELEIKKQRKTSVEADDDEDFKDAYDEDEYAKQKENNFEEVNEFEFQFYMKKGEMNMKCFLSDLRMVFSMPTLQRLVKIQLSLQDVFDVIEQNKETQRIRMLNNLELVSSNLKNESISEEIKEEQIQTSSSVKSKLSKTIKELAKQKMTFEAKLTNFSVWIPLKPAEFNSQIISLSFMADFDFLRESESENTIEQEFNQVVKQKLMLAKDEIKLNINQFAIQNISFQDKKAFIYMGSFKNKQACEGKYREINMLSPCRMQICMDNKTTGKSKQQKFQFISSFIKVNIEPMQLKVGFQQIDFANLMLVEIQTNILKQFEDREAQIKSFMKDQAETYRMKSKSELYLEESKENKQETMRRSQAQQRKTIALKKQQKQAQQLSKKTQKTSSVIAGRVKFRCEKLTLALIDDSLLEGAEDNLDLQGTNIEELEQQLIQVSIQDCLFHMKTYLKKDDAGTYILKRLGIYQKAHPDIFKKEMYLSANAETKFEISYFNQRTLVYEPFIEPWIVRVKMDQDAPYTEKRILIESSHLFNVNMTFGMALTLRSIIDRLEQSQKQAKKLEHMYEKIGKINKVDDQDDDNEEEEKGEINLRSTQVKISQHRHAKIDLKANQGGSYLFFNYSGLPLRFTLHNNNLNEELELEKPESHLSQLEGQSGFMVASLKKEIDPDQVFYLDGKDPLQTIVKSFQDLNMMQYKIKETSAQGKIVETLEEEPIKIDIKISSLHKLQGVPIEGLGVFSYEVAVLRSAAQQQIQAQHQNKNSDKGDKGGLFGFGLLGKGGDKDAKKTKLIDKIGIICNIKMEGQFKKVQIESQVLLVNNLINCPITISVATSTQKLNDLPANQMVTIQSGESFRVPIAWFLSDEPYSMYIDGRSQQYMVFKDFIDYFCSNQEQSKLTQSHSQIVILKEGYYTSIDIQGFKCLPKSQQTGPLQYLVSFNPPLVVSNYNFSPLQIELTKSKEVLALIAPKEAAYITQLDPLNGKPNLSWTFYEHQAMCMMMSGNFNLLTKIDQLSQEKFIIQENNNLKLNKDKQKGAIFEMDVHKNYFLELSQSMYDGENFQLRQKMCDFTISAQLLIYPKFMVVNKNSINLICDNHNFNPLSTQYLSLPTNQSKVSFKVPGYKSSQWLDVSTVGLSGSFELEQDKINEIQLDKMPQEYAPQRLEYGIQIQSAETPFNKTTLVNLVPRYVIVNQLKKPLVIKQVGLKQQVLIQSQGQVAYNFEQKSNKLILVRECLSDEINAIARNKGLFPDMAKDSTYWSSPFSIEDIEDFQIAFSATPNMKEEQTIIEWYNPSIVNYYQRFVRVIITTQDDATILVVFTNPLYPEYEIQNKSDQKVQFAQLIDENLIKKGISSIKFNSKLEDSIVGKSFKQLDVRTTTPYAWEDRIHTVKKLLLKIDGAQDVINLDKALKKKVLTSPTSQMKYSVEVRVDGNAKRLRITNMTGNAKKANIIKSKKSGKHADTENNQAMYLQNLLKRKQGQLFRIDLNIKGIGISIIDDQPRELLFLALYKIDIELQRWMETRSDGSGVIELVNKIRLGLDHLQLDNMASQNMPVILAPSRLINKVLSYIYIQSLLQTDENDKEEEKGGKSSNKKKKGKNQQIEQYDSEAVITPFIQLNISLAEGYGAKNDATKVVRLRSFQFALQEFVFNLDTTILNINLKFVEELVKVFTQQKKMKFTLATNEGFSRSLLNSKEKYCERLDARKALLTESQVITSNKMFMEYIHLGAIKAILTFRLEKKEFDFDLADPKRGFGAFNLVYSFMATAASITNSSFQFKELILIDTFISQDMLIMQLAKNYGRQGVMQFYKLLGASDMIGNPLGFVDKLGTGVFEFFSEPKKGLLQGPEEFAGGIGKGVKSLVTNVVSGSFDSISKITGSLYQIVKVSQGESNVSLKKPDHVFDGLYQGVIGGGQEIYGGLKGLVTKPIEGAKEAGFIGMIGGAGKGIFGAVSAPVSATLRLGSQVAQGVSSTATTIGNIGKDTIADSPYSRFRPPRYINIRNVIKPYDEESSMVYQLLADIQKGHYANATMKYFCSIPETNNHGELANPQTLENNSLILITDEHFLYIKMNKDSGSQNKGKILFKSRLSKIDHREIYTGKPMQAAQKKQMAKDKQVEESKSSLDGQEYYCLVIHRRKSLTHRREKNLKYIFVTLEYIKFEKIYEILAPQESTCKK